MFIRWVLLIILVINLFGCGGKDSAKSLGNSSSNQLRELGFKNLGNTCYANSALKLLSACPDLLELLDPKRDISASDYYPGLLNQKNQIKNSLYKLFNKYQSHNRPMKESHSEFYETELNDLFDQLDQFLELAKDGSGPKKGERGFIRGQTWDAEDFLQRALLILNFNQTFKKSSRSISNDPDNPIEILTHDDPILNLPIAQASSKDSLSLSDLFRTNFERVEEVNPSRGITATFHNKMLVYEGDQIPSYFFLRTEHLESERSKATSSIDFSLPVTVPVSSVRRGEEERVWDSPVKLESVTYYPTGFIIYTGNHFYTYLLNQKSGSWFKHDDQKVTVFQTDQEKGKFKNDINSNTYIILYSIERESPAAG